MPRRFLSRSLLALISLAVPATASADWLLAGYLGATKTPATTLTIRDRGVGTLVDIQFAGKPFKSPPYYGYRISWVPKKQSGWGPEAEFIHAKTIAVDTKSTALTAFEQSHGLNFILGNAAYRPSAFCGGRCNMAIPGGARISQPQVEAT
jgi:hypothetical protein